MQVDPIKATLKAPESMHLKLIYDGPLSNFAFKFDLRRYSEEDIDIAIESCPVDCIHWAEAYTRQLLSST